MHGGLPFAMQVSGKIGGLPDLTAVFVVLTGVAALGDLILATVPLRSALARGALFGAGAHGAGTARAHQNRREEGAVAGLVMVLAGLMNVLGCAISREAATIAGGADESIVAFVCYTCQYWRAFTLRMPEIQSLGERVAKADRYKNRRFGQRGCHHLGRRRTPSGRWIGSRAARANEGQNRM